MASRLLPRRVRRHLLAFYGFARFTDELGDSYHGDRLAALDWLEDATRAGLGGRPSGHPLIDAAAASVGELQLDPAPLFDLITANRMDQGRVAYATFEELRGYCAKSADPVGRLVLGAFGHTDTRLHLWSDAVCTGLQLVEHWQDVREDALAARIYLPAEDLDRFGVATDELTGTAPSSPRLRALMVFEVARARQQLQAGEALIGALSGPARWAVAGFIAGGLAALDRIASRDFEVLLPAGRPPAARIARHLLGAFGSTGRAA